MSTPLKMSLPARRAIVSCMVGMGQLSFLVTLFSLRQSTHHLILPPFFLTVTRLELHRLSAGSMTSCRSQSFSCSRRAPVLG